MVKKNLNGGSPNFESTPGAPPDESELITGGRETGPPKLTKGGKMKREGTLLPPKGGSRRKLPGT